MQRVDKKTPLEISKTILTIFCTCQLIRDKNLFFSFLFFSLQADSFFRVSFKKTFRRHCWRNFVYLLLYVRLIELSLRLTHTSLIKPGFNCAYAIKLEIKLPDR